MFGLFRTRSHFVRKANSIERLKHCTLISVRNLLASLLYNLFDFQNNFLQHFVSLKPLKSSQTKLRSAMRTAAQSWLKLLVNLTWFTDGQQMVMKMPTAVDVLLELCQARHTKHVRDHALLVLRNLCFHGPSKPVLLANGECCGTVPQVKPYKYSPFHLSKANLTETRRLPHTNLSEETFKEEVPV